MEAEEFSREIGGTDADVKEYFFSLHGSELDSIFSKYGQLHGVQAEQYARKTINKWRSGTRRMSGLVAKRLFDLLPPRMPPKKKYELAENVWKHFGPSSTQHFRVGPNTSIADISDVVMQHLNGVVNSYSIPKDVQNRFNWLADGDIRVKEDLLNFFRKMERDLMLERVSAEMPVLQRQMLVHDDITDSLRSVIQVHKHEVNIWVDKDLDDTIVEGRRIPKSSAGYGGKAWWWLIAIGVGTFFLLSQ
jgi:hypothetical protein